ncbi:hypothetical protein JQ610_25150 [Bradyrhizobium diazoefficiens]|nr:hypothetical protein [Bradyrhizobium diazoefficiens]MBR1010159.1 hypothetical protein [Bradyrhizobium diazoefficiens]
MSDDLTLPWSIEDGAKAFKQVFKIFDEIAKRTRGAADYFVMRRRRNAAEDIDYLRFGQGGSLPNVARIARGEGTSEDFAEIKRHMNETAEPVEQVIIKLTSAGNSKLIREKIGIDALALLEKIIYGDQGVGGKTAVRHALYDLSNLGGDPGAAQDTAKAILKLIEQLNLDIISLHNALLKHRAKRAKDAAKKAEKKLVAKAAPAAKEKPPEKAKPKTTKKPAAKKTTKAKAAKPPKK